MNKIRNLYKLCLVFLVFLLPEATEAQSLSLNHSFLNDYYRQQQLLGKVDPALSFVIRPLTSQALQSRQLFDPEGKVNHLDELPFGSSYSFYEGDGKLDLLPISILSQYNSHHPEGYNDGAMIPARGAQMRLDLGLHVEYKWFSLTLNPELVYAHNKLYEGYPDGYTNMFGVTYPKSQFWGDQIDLPERMGDFHYTKLHWGQSSLRVNYKGLSLGVSSENLWWGPGYKNSLLMSNTAPGFLHATFNTRSPIQTFIGAFEWQLIGGKLENSGQKDGLDDWVYLNSIVFSYKPKWIKGLFLGFTRSFMTNESDLGSGIGDYLPVITSFFRGSSDINQAGNGYNQLISGFFRWHFPEAHGEVYGEYGREDHSENFRDFVQEPAHSSAYLLGVRKLIPLKKKAHIQCIVEIAHIATSQTTINRGSGSSEDRKTARGGWYLHSQVRQGYTHKGQVLGAGIGPGSNSQTFNISWNQGIKQLGVELERYAHNKDFWINHIKDFRANWVDLSASAFAHWDYRYFFFYGKAKLIRSKNYQWLYEPTWPEVQADYWTHTDDTFNFHLQVGVTYRF